MSIHTSALCHTQGRGFTLIPCIVHLGAAFLPSSHHTLCSERSPSHMSSLVDFHLVDFAAEGSMFS